MAKTIFEFLHVRFVSSLKLIFKRKKLWKSATDTCRLKTVTQPKVQQSRVWGEFIKLPKTNQLKRSEWAIASNTAHIQLALWSMHDIFNWNKSCVKLCPNLIVFLKSLMFLKMCAFLSHTYWKIITEMNDTKIRKYPQMFLLHIFNFLLKDLLLAKFI